MKIYNQLKKTMHTIMELYGRQWEKVNDFRPSDNDWLVVTTELGELWMNITLTGSCTS